MCIYTHISDCVQTVYQLPSLPNNNTTQHIYTNQSGANCWLDIYRWGAGLAVTGPIRHIGQNVLQSSFATWSSSSPVTATFCSLSHSSREAFKWTCISCVIIMRINHNNLVNNNNDGWLQDLILLFKIPVGIRKYFFEAYRQFGHTPSKVFTSHIVICLYIKFSSTVRFHHKLSNSLVNTHPRRAPTASS